MAVKWSHLRDWCGKALDHGEKSQHLAVSGESAWIAGNDECERCTIFHICKMNCGGAARGGGTVLFGAILRGIRRDCGELRRGQSDTGLAECNANFPAKSCKKAVFSEKTDFFGVIMRAKCAVRFLR